MYGLAACGMYSDIAYFQQNVCPCHYTCHITFNKMYVLAACGMYSDIAYFQQNVCPCRMWLIVVLLTLDKMYLLVAFGL